MEIVIRHIEECPNLDTAEERVRTALRAVGVVDATLRRELVRDLSDTERLGFIGSPTIVIDGTDPFADHAGSVALACRLYHSPTGPAGAPSVEELERAIEGRT
jgi:hypothetical protein